jgi:TPR repeat protein
VRCFERAAEKGVVAAQGRWGAALMDGAFVCRDHERAEHWLRRAGAGGDAEAAARVGDLHARGSLNSRPNFAEAAAWYRRAAEAGHKPAARALASLHLTGAGVAQDFAAAASWLRLAAGENDGRPGIVSGDVDGQIVDREGQKADVAALLEREAAKGDLVASLHLGLWLTQDVGRPSDRAKAAHRLRVGASETPTAQYLHGRMLAEGLGETADLEAARSLFARAAKAGIVDAQAALAEMLVNGRGGPADISEAARLFEQAAKQGHSGAMFALGVLHARGGQAGLAGAAALRWFREAARLGHGHAQLALARLLSSARFGEADHEEAEMWLRSAAENGLAEAQRQLAAERIRSERPASAPQSASVAT